MKRAIVIAGCLLTGLFASAQTKKDSVQKVYTLQLTENEILELYNVLEFSKQSLPTSEAPAKSVTLALKSIEQLEATLAKKYKEQQKK